MAHCHLGLGELYAKIGKHVEARAELTAAADLYRAMELTFWLPRAESALAERRGPAAPSLLRKARELLRSRTWAPAGPLRYSVAMEPDPVLDFCERHGVVALYLFGSRAADGLKRLCGQPVSREGSDLDIGVVLGGERGDGRRLARLQVAFEELFAPLRVDLVPLDRVDALVQFAAIDGYRVAATDASQADLYELDIMRRAAELQPIERWIERETFGIATT